MNLCNTKYYGEDSRGNQRYDCPFCDDKKGKFYININTGLFQCWRASCGKKGIWKDFIRLVPQNNELSEDEKLYNLKLQFWNKLPKDALNFLKKRCIETHPSFRAVKQAFKVNIDDDKDVDDVWYLERRLAFRSLDLSGHNICHYSFRDYSGESDAKVIHPSARGFVNMQMKSKTLFFHPRRWDHKKVIPAIVEGDMGALSIYHAVGDWHVVGCATYGAYISDVQARYFAKFPKVIYVPDNDAPDSLIQANFDLLYSLGANILLYDKSDYKGRKDDPNDVLMREGRFIIKKTNLRKFYV